MNVKALTAQKEVDKVAFNMGSWGLTHVKPTRVDCLGMNIQDLDKPLPGNRFEPLVGPDQSAKAVRYPIPFSIKLADKILDRF